MKRVVCVLLAAFLVVASSCRKDEKDPFAGKDTVTIGVEDVTFYLVTLSGYHSTEKSGTYGFFMNTNRNNLESNFGNKRIQEDNYNTWKDGGFYKIKTTVKPATTYYFRSYFHTGGVSADAEQFVGEILSFTTPDCTLQAYTDGAEVKSPVEVELKGHITVDGDSPSYACIFHYGTSQNQLDQTVPTFLMSAGEKSFSKTFAPPQVGVTYYYKIEVDPLLGDEYVREGEVKSFTVPGPTSGNPVDLGTSVKWASCNVGASSPEQYGKFFMWGETSQRSTWPLDNPYTDIPTVLPSSRDAATANLGSPWRMPTRAEFSDELGAKCIAYKTRYKGKNGVLFVSKQNGNSIFLPSAGYYYNSYGYEGTSCFYWSASPALQGTEAYASAFYTLTYLDSGRDPAVLDPPFVNNRDRADGAPVRAVRQ